MKHSAGNVLKDLKRWREEDPRLDREVTKLQIKRIIEDVICAKEWLIPGRKINQVEIDACISELKDVIHSLRRLCEKRRHHRPRTPESRPRSKKGVSYQESRSS